MDSRIDAGDQVALPGEALDLPDAQDAKSGEEEKGDQRQADRKGRGAPSTLPSSSPCHGISLIFCIVDMSCMALMSMSACGIMLALR